MTTKTKTKKPAKISNTGLRRTYGGVASSHLGSPGFGSFQQGLLNSQLEALRQQQNNAGGVANNVQRTDPPASDKK